MVKGRLHSIETMGLLDGPGIRTVFFLQGCPLQCAYCHNPDTQAFHKGKEISPEEVVTIAKRYQSYYSRSGGGVTFSGGEPLMQGEFLAETVRLLKLEGIHTAIDTCGFGNEQYYDAVLENVDTVILDIKHFEEEAHYALTGRSMKGNEKFLRRLKDYKGKVWIRHVMVPGYTDHIESMDQLYKKIHFLGNKIEKIEILPYHKIGVEKYTQLGLEYKLQETPEMDKDKALEFEKYVMNLLKKDKEAKSLNNAV